MLQVYHAGGRVTSGTEMCLPHYSLDISITATFEFVTRSPPAELLSQISDIQHACSPCSHHSCQ